MFQSEKFKKVEKEKIKTWKDDDINGVSQRLTRADQVAAHAMGICLILEVDICIYPDVSYISVDIFIKSDPTNLPSHNILNTPLRYSTIAILNKIPFPIPSHRLDSQMY